MSLTPVLTKIILFLFSCRPILIT